MPEKVKRGPGRPKSDTQVASITFQADLALRDRLDAVAKADRRSRTFIIVEAIKAGLAMMEAKP